MNKHSETSHDPIGLGILFGGGAALIWGAWPVITALGVQASLSPLQLVMLRIFVSAPLLLPWVFRGRNSWREWRRVLLLSLLAGAPYSFIASSGFSYTSATHGGVIIPGTIMLTSLFASHFFLHDRLNRFRILGAIGILVGLALLAFGAAGGGNSASLIGDLIFAAAGVLWASYTLLLRLWPMDPVVVTARVAFVSLFWVGAALPFTGIPDFSDIPTDMLTLQIVWQGTISSVLAIIFFNKGVAILGAARASVLNAIIPVVSTLLAFFILSEVPTGLEQAGLLSILIGIFIAMFLTPKPQQKPHNKPVVTSPEN